MMKKYDVAIIGAGIGGLICGTYLSKYGLKVLIVERHYKVGGCVTSVKKDGHIFDVGAHLIGSCNDMGLFQKYLKELGISVPFAQLNPTDRYHLSDDVIDVPVDLNSFIEMLAIKFPKEKTGIYELFAEIVKVAYNFDAAAILDKYQDSTFKDLAFQYIHDEKLLAIIAAQFYYIGLSPGKVSALSMCLMLTSYLKDGSYCVVGGAQILPDLIFKRFKELGGEGLLKTSAISSEEKNNKITKIILDNGNEVLADFVVSDIDVHQLFKKIVGVQHLPEDCTRFLNTAKIGNSFFLLFLLSDLSKEQLAGKSGWYHSSYELDSGVLQSFYVHVPSEYFNNNGAKFSVIQLALPCDYDSFNVANYENVKRCQNAKLLSMAENYIKGLTGSVKMQFSATPRTIERYTLNSKGSMYGWEMSPSHVQRNRLSNDSSIANLFLVGQWTKPGCGVVSVATSGWKIGKKIISMYKKVAI